MRHIVQQAVAAFRNLRGAPLYHMFERKIKR